MEPEEFDPSVMSASAEGRYSQAQRQKPAGRM